MSLKMYYPEMGEAKPEARIDAYLSHWGKHYFLYTSLSLSGQGVTFIKTITNEDSRTGRNVYKVTLKAFDRITNRHDVSYQMLLD